VQIASNTAISYMPLMLMEADQLIEKRQGRRLPDLKCHGRPHQARPHERRDPLRSLHFPRRRRSAGTIWARSRGTIDSSADGHERDAALLTPANPTSKPSRTSREDKSHWPGVKVSIQAVTLQIRREGFGPGNQGQLDAFTVAMLHPDGSKHCSRVGARYRALLLAAFPVSAAKQPGIRRVLNLLTFSVDRPRYVCGHAKIPQENPNLCAFHRGSTRHQGDQCRQARTPPLPPNRNDKKSSVDDIAAMLERPRDRVHTTPKT